MLAFRRLAMLVSGSCMQPALAAAESMHALSHALLEILEV